MMSSGDALMMSAHTGWLFAGWLSYHVQTQGHMLYMAQSAKSLSSCSMQVGAII